MDDALELHPLLSARWSPASFDPDHEASERDVATLIEAARWAPSAGNSQPWAFIASRRGDDTHVRLVRHLAGSSRGWAPAASILVANLCHLLVEDTDWEYSEFAGYDLGQAVAHMTVQAAALGLRARQFRAFDRDAVAAEFGIPPHWQVTTMTAFGHNASRIRNESDDRTPTCAGVPIGSRREARSPSTLWCARVGDDRLRSSRSGALMKAARFSRFGGPEVLEIVDLPDPHPGPGQIRIAVRAAGVNASDWKKRAGLMDEELPQALGYEAAGIVDELGDGVTDVAVGDRVFGLSAAEGAQAEFAVLAYYAPVPPSLDFAGAAALPAAVETATRALDQLGVASGSTLLVNGASGSVGSAAVQLAVARGARVIGTASPANHDYLRALGAEPVAYGAGLVDRVRALAPTGVDLALDVAGSGVLPELIDLAGGAANVITVADFQGAGKHGVRFSRGDDGRALHALVEIGGLIEAGRFSLPVAQSFPLAEIAEAHRVGEHGHRRGKLVLLVG